jgi:hypothetical protein
VANTSQEGCHAPPYAQIKKAGLLMAIPDLDGHDPAWFAPAANQTSDTQAFYRGRQHERELIIDKIRARICFDALADHDAMATFRVAHPEIVGRCSNHGGKCTDLLQLIYKLESGN